MDLTLATAAILLGLGVFGSVVTQWRSGIFIILGVGFLQDPLRKLVPGEPVAISIAVVVVTLFVWVVGLNRFGGNRGVMGLGRYNPRLANALIIFTGLVLFQSMVTIVTTGSLIIAGIGLIAYLSPMPPIWIGWWHFRKEVDIFPWLLIYVLFGIVVAIGVYLSWMGADWKVLEQVGEGLLIYDPIAGAVETHSGFMRVAEIAAWHMGAAACFAIVLATTRPSLPRIVMFSLAIAFIIPAIFLTGRRKGLAMIGLFVGFAVILFQFSRDRQARKASIALAGLALGTLSTLFYVTEDASDASAFRPYAVRGESVYGDAWDRFYDLGLGSGLTAIQYVGFLGYGAGVFSQGAQHFGIELSVVGGGAEGGLGKIVLELGIPGLIVMAWVAWVFFSSIRNMTRAAGSGSQTNSTIMLSLMAFLLVNGILFVTASQVFGDPFVLIVLGTIFGAVLSLSRILASPPAVRNQSFSPYDLRSNQASWRHKEGRP